MQLYKSRGFSELFQDTFAFLKQHGKHFFKHYFIINGIFLIILLILTYFFTKFYTEFLFGGLMNSEATVMDEYMNENLGLFIILFIIFFIVAIIAGTISYAYMPIYLKLYTERDGTSFSTQDIIAIYKTNIGKLATYILCSILLGIPLLIGFSIGAIALAITFIGLLALPFLVGAFMLFYSMTLMEYIKDKKGIWECFGYSWKLISSKFWAAIGSVGLFYLMSYIIQNIVSLIPYVFGMARLFTTIDSGSPSQEEISSTMMIIMLLVFFLSFLLSATLGNIVQLNQGIVFYSLKEENENINTKSIIDQIGSGE